MEKKRLCASIGGHTARPRRRHQSRRMDAARASQPSSPPESIRTPPMAFATAAPLVAMRAAAPGGETEPRNGEARSAAAAAAM